MHADRNGRPTVRVAYLPRLRWPGLLVWDEAGQGGGRYQVMREIRRSSGTYEPTGFSARTVGELIRILERI